ncbi:MAG: ABC transporter ATP-binding protein, partial [Bacteroidia bacterium]|nr:ABC transporter ATP-binding protein [Bacteroidia bacterium]
VNRGEIYGFLGLNGAGKTTVIRMLLGMIKPSGGSIRMFGQTLDSGFRQWNKIGYLVEAPYSYPKLTVYENLKVYFELRSLKDTSYIDRIIDRLKLTPYKHRRAGQLSLGNQQRLGIAKALFHDPELLILDEPINGLDPEGIVEIRNLLKELASNGTTIFISSHILSEMARIADRIGIIHHGNLLNELQTTELSELLVSKLILSTDNNRRAKDLLIQNGYSALENELGEIELMDDQICKHPESISRLLMSEGIYPKKLLVVNEDLEQFFLRTIKS